MTCEQLVAVTKLLDTDTFEILDKHRLAAQMVCLRNTKCEVDVNPNGRICYYAIGGNSHHREDDENGKPQPAIIDQFGSVQYWKHGVQFEP